MVDTLSPDAFKAKALADAEVREHYEGIEDEFLLLREFIEARHHAGKTQSNPLYKNSKALSSSTTHRS